MTISLHQRHRYM